MDTAFWIEMIGYLGSLLVVISMLMASVVKLRIINITGSVISGIYSVIIASYPLMVMNVCLITINIYNLAKLFHPTKHYDMIVADPKESFLEYFLTRYKEDILKYFPAFEEHKSQAAIAYIFLCNNEPAGVLLGRHNQNGILDIILDYTTPTYRDCSVAKYQYKKLPSQGIHTLAFSQPKAPEHRSYMKKMGFVKEDGVYIKKLG